MVSRIEQLIDEIEEFIDRCKYQRFSNENIIVNKEEIDELLRELRMKTPEEISRCQKMISNKEAIMEEARKKANQLIDEATAQTTELVSEHEIMQQAYTRANEILELATNQAQEILDNATNEANAMREATVQYTDDILANIENILGHSIDVAAAKYENLIASLQDCNEIVTSNRAELHQVPEEETPVDTPAQVDEDDADGEEDSELDLI